MRPAPLLAVLLLSLLVSGCPTLGAESGWEVQERLLPGMTWDEALDVLQATGSVSGISRFDRSPVGGAWVAGDGARIQDPDELGAAEHVSSVEERLGRRILWFAQVDRTYGWMSWDVFLLCFDEEHRLVEHEVLHLD